MTIEYGSVQDNTARARTNYAPISFKASVQICKAIKGREVSKAIAYLERVVEQKDAIPYVKYNMDLGHKRGMGPGRYPVKASAYFITLLNNAIKNAKDKGLNENGLVIKELVANRTMSRTWAKRYGRGRVTSLWVVVEEAVKSAKKEQKKTDKKEETAKEIREEKKEDNEENAKEGIKAEEES